MSLARLLAVLLLVPLVGCTTVGFDSRDVPCGPPQFAYADGWLGGDAAFSVPLGGERTVWLFGDTFVGSPDQKDRIGSKFIHNSIGISECLPNGTWQIEYAWGVDDEGSPSAFFHDTSEDTYWWLFDGFVFEGALYVGLLIVEGSEPRGPLNLPFRYRGMRLARVENPHDDPRQWRTVILPLSDSRIAFPGSAMVVHGDYVYLFAFLDRDATRYPRILARIPLVGLKGPTARPIDHLEYLDRSREWKPGFEPDDALVVMEDDASEMSVNFHSESGRWVAVYNYPNITIEFPRVPPSDLVYMRTAESLEGPWSEPASIFRIPELDSRDLDGRHPNTFCYAAKGHQEQARSGHLLLTYVCNLFTPKGADPFEILLDLMVEMHLYRPIAVSIPHPLAQHR